MLKIIVQYHGHELTVEGYETEFGIVYRAKGENYGGISFNEEGWVDYCRLIKEWKKLVDKVLKTKGV